MKRELPTTEIFEFGTYRLDAARRQLWNGTATINIGSRAFDILQLLLRHAGAIVEKHELMAAVWPGLHVEEANLRVHIATLRRLLPSNDSSTPYIVNEAGRGYRFMGPVHRPDDKTQLSSSMPQITRLPTRITRIIGRDDLLKKLSNEFSQHRCLSIVGAGGIGKTTIALSLAAQVWPQFQDGVDFIDLAPLQEAGLAPNTVALSLGLAVRSEDETESILAFLQGRHKLLIFDNCEHVIDAAAPLIEKICAAAPDVRVITTSRELLAIEGERIHRLAPLASPPTGEATAERIASYPAVQLFVERASSHAHSFVLTAQNAERVAEICRRLDGLPLALELAAGSVDAFGIEGLAQGLDDRFQLLTRGRRTALPRQRTLRLTLDWSHDLLAADERKVLRRLGCFIGSFSLDAAKGVVCDTTLPPDHLTAAISNLVSKSLVFIESIGGPARYRLLDTTRAYALEHLAATDETSGLRARHACWYRQLLDLARQDAPSASLKYLQPDIENIRLAIGWALSPAGDHSIATGLVSAAAPLLLDLSLYLECMEWSQKALGHITESDRGTRVEMELAISYAMPFLYTKGNGPELRQTLEHAHSLACAVGDTGYQALILDGLYMFHARAGNAREIFGVADRARSLFAVTRDPMSSHLWISGIGHSMAGNHPAAVETLGPALQQLPVTRPATSLRIGVDHRVNAGNAFSVSLWMLGRRDEALAMIGKLIEEAEESGNPISLTVALSWTVPIALWMNDLPLERARLTRLEESAQKANLTPAMLVAMGLRGAVEVRAENSELGLQWLDQSLTGLRQRGNGYYEVALMMYRSEALLALGRLEEAMAAVVDALALCDQRGDAIYTPPLHILRGRISSAKNAGRAAVVLCLETALQWARRQGAVFYERPILDLLNDA